MGTKPMPYFEDEEVIWTARFTSGLQMRRAVVWRVLEDTPIHAEHWGKT
jgi:hypothetical protein